MPPLTDTAPRRLCLQENRQQQGGPGANSSLPNSTAAGQQPPPPPEDGLWMEEEAERDEADSSTARAPAEAAAELRRSLAVEAGSDAQATSPAELSKKVWKEVDLAFRCILKYHSQQQQQHDGQQQGQGQRQEAEAGPAAAAGPAEAAAAVENASAEAARGPALAAGSGSGGGRRVALDAALAAAEAELPAWRCVLLKHAAIYVPDLTKQHKAAYENSAKAGVAVACMQQCLLRLHICCYGER